MSHHDSPQLLAHFHLSHRSSQITKKCWVFQSKVIFGGLEKFHLADEVKRYSHFFNHISAIVEVRIITNFSTKPLATKSFSIWLIYGANSSENVAISKLTHLCWRIAIVAQTQQFLRVHWFRIILFCVMKPSNNSFITSEEWRYRIFTKPITATRARVLVYCPKY